MTDNETEGAVREIQSTVVEALGAALLDMAWAGDESCLASWREEHTTPWTGEPGVLAAAPWLMIHHYLCHPGEPADTRGRCRSDCPFFEGWMDEVAFGLLSLSVMSERRPRSESDVVTWHRDEMLQAARDLRGDHYRSGGGEHRFIPQQWALGRETARVLLRFFASCSWYEQEEMRKRAAIAQLVGLSFRIQAATASPAGLRRIVNSCLLAGQCASTFMRVAERGELLRLLTQPIVDINEWITRLESLWRHFPI